MTGPKRATEKQLTLSRWNALTHGIVLTPGALSQAIIPPPLQAYQSRHSFDQLLCFTTKPPHTRPWWGHGMPWPMGRSPHSRCRGDGILPLRGRPRHHPGPTCVLAEVASPDDTSKKLFLRNEPIFHRMA